MSSVANRHISLDGHDVPAIVVGYIARRFAIAAVLCLPFFVVGVLLLFDPDGATKVIGAAIALFFGGGAIALVVQALRPGFVALTREGIAAQSRFGLAFAPWHAVVGVGRQYIGRNEMIVMDVDDPASIRTSAGIGWLKALNAMAGYPDLAFPTNLLGGGSEVLETGVRVYATEPERRGRIGTAAELETLLAESWPEPPPDRTSETASAPRLARIVLWVIGGLGLLVSLAALLGEGDPARTTARVTGAVVVGAISLACIGAAWLVGRRPRAGRIVGLFAAAGMLFVALLSLTRGEGFGPTVVIGLVLLAAGATVGWQLLRWRPAAERGRRGDATRDPGVA